MQRYDKPPKFKRKIEISGCHLLILIINQKELCAKLKLTPAYAKHLPMFGEYLEFQEHGEKKTYIYEYLAERYKMHTSSVRKVIARLLRTVAVCA